MSEKLGAGVLQRKTAEEESRPAVQALPPSAGGRADGGSEETSRIWVSDDVIVLVFVA